MKDLYLKLKLEPSASTTEIAAALELKPDLKDYSSILLDDERRATYDRAHATLISIGLLRHRLNLNSHHPWFMENYPDFMPRLRTADSGETPKETPSENPATEVTPNQPTQKQLQAKTHRTPRWLIPALLGVIVIGLLALWYATF